LCCLLFYIFCQVPDFEIISLVQNDCKKNRNKTLFILMFNYGFKCPQH